MGRMEKNMETTIMGYIGMIGYMSGLYRDTGKENGNHYSRIGFILVLYRNNGKEHETAI